MNCLGDAISKIKATTINTNTGGRPVISATQGAEKGGRIMKFKAQATK